MPHAMPHAHARCGCVPYAGRPAAAAYRARAVPLPRRGQQAGSIASATPRALRSCKVGPRSAAERLRRVWEASSLRRSTAPLVPQHLAVGKLAATVCARRPFARDAALDYGVDSDEEWEEEPEGEEIGDGDAMDDDEPEVAEVWGVDASGAASDGTHICVWVWGVGSHARAYLRAPPHAQVHIKWCTMCCKPAHLAVCFCTWDFAFAVAASGHDCCRSLSL
eukprot:351666-Chlamydomonas_euryale.AAC.8